MKIGIITIVKVNNYGAELQAYATQKKLEILGYEAELIDYRYYKSWNFKDSKMSVSLMPLGMKDKILYRIKYRLINGLVTNLFPILNGNVKRRFRRFDDFHKENSRFSRLYASMDELYKNVPEYEVYMTGSDQVWNPSADSSIEPYFLTFAQAGKKRVSYASSFGVSSIDEKLHERFSTWLSEYDSIAVREDGGRELVKSLTGKEAEWVIDPTLLLNKEEWMCVAKDYVGIPEKYVLIYQLSASTAIEQLALRIGKKKNMPVYRICKRAYGVRKTDGIKNILDAGPAEFLSLIANTDCLITNSFHGTAFSINFGIPFFTIVSSTNKNNSRMESLLGLVGLKNRMIKDDVVISDVDVESAIMFEKAHQLLNDARVKSVNYLMKALC